MCLAPISTKSFLFQRSTRTWIIWLPNMATKVFLHHLDISEQNVWEFVEPVDDAAYASGGCPSRVNDVASVKPATRNYINLAAHVTNHYGLFKIGQQLVQSHILPNSIFNQKAFIQLLLSCFEAIHSSLKKHCIYFFSSIEDPLLFSINWHFKAAKLTTSGPASLTLFPCWITKTASAVYKIYFRLNGWFHCYKVYHK